MNQFLKLPDSERAAVFNDVATKMNIPAGYVEKDFWVCWMLDLLFTSPELSPHLTFRGGTSLSKAYQAINRFSEDIDLSVSRDWLGITTANDPALANTNSQAERRQKHLRQLTREKLAGSVLPLLQNTITQILPDKETSLDPEGEKSPFDTSRDPYCIYFTYPSLVAMPTGYITAQVKLEFSARAEGVPEETRTIQSFAAEHYPQTFSKPKIDVHTVTPQRTFWEKAFIIHEANTAPETKLPQPRLSRHYYDLHQLITHGLAPSDDDLFQQVKEHRKHYFRQTWVNYDSITPADLQFTPPERLEEHWQSDYRQMKSMIWGERSSLQKTIQTIAEKVS